MDASVVINLIHADFIALLSELPPYRFVIPDHVAAEVTDAEQNEKLTAAIAAGHTQVVAVTGTDALSAFSELTQVMGRGEAGSLALAQSMKAYIACDEKKGPFRREALKRLGAERILNTQSIILHAVKLRRMSVERADQAKATLEANRYKMDFKSFADLL